MARKKLKTPKAARRASKLERIDAATWRHAWELKVYGYIDLTRLVHARMKSRRRGVIVNISSMAGRVPLRGCAYYGGAKAGLAMASPPTTIPESASTITPRKTALLAP